MRKVLFKAKRTDNGEWVEGYYLRAGTHWYKKGIHNDWIVVDAIQNGGFLNLLKRYAVDPKTLCMYTGLTDKDGRDVFEGDKLHCEYYLFGELYKKDYTVSWGDGNYFLKPIGTGLSDEFSMDILLSCEVIGNIYDDEEKETNK